LSEDTDGDGKVDCGEDLNCNGVLDTGEDQNGNEILDLAEDVDEDGNLDVDEDTNGDGHLNAGEDVDGDNHLDYSEDFDNDGHLDVYEDTNGNGSIDTFSYYRIASNYAGDWSTVATNAIDPAHHLYNLDVNDDGSVNTRDQIPAGNIGWVFDLPGKIDFDGDGQDNDGDGVVDEDGERLPGERMINDTILRDGKAIMISFGVTGTRCNAGAYSFVNERNPNTGGMLLQEAFDLNGDGEVDNRDFVYIQVPYDVDGDGDIDEDDVVPGIPSDSYYEGRLYNPAILRENEYPTTGGDVDPEEVKYFSSSAGAIQTMDEAGEVRGVYYWQQVE